MNELHSRITDQPVHAVITGDVISSRKHDQALWSSKLKAVLATVGEEGAVWEIFRGDAFLFFVLTEPRSQALQVMLARSASLLIRRGASSTRALSTFYTESHEWLKVV